MAKVGYFFIYFVFQSLIFSATLCFFELKDSLNNGFEYSILVCSIIFCSYVVYCKFTKKYLKEIKFNIHKELAKERILEYGKKYHFRISKISDNLIFLNEPTDNYSFGTQEKLL